MADFRTHVTVSSAAGAGYAVVASGMGYNLSTALVAGGLCGVAGMLPDVDSDSGVPRRESLGFAAAIVPMLLIDRFKEMNLAHDQMVLLGAAIYFGVRYVAANLIGRWSVHRGMWHSIPAVLIFAGLAFLMSSSTNVFDRYLKAFAVGLGAMSHLVLDEIYSVDTRGVVPRLKKSFGTAVKLWGKDPWANFSVYAKLAVVSSMILMEPMVIDRLELRNPELAAKVRGAAEEVDAIKERFAQRSDTAIHNPAPTAQAPPPAYSAQPVADFSAPPPSGASPVNSGPSGNWAPPPTSPATPSPWFAPPGAGGGSFAPNRSDAASPPGQFTR